MSANGTLFGTVPTLPHSPWNRYLQARVSQGWHLAGVFVLTRFILAFGPLPPHACISFSTDGTQTRTKRNRERHVTHVTALTRPGLGANRMRVINYQPSYPTDSQVPRRGNAEQLKIPVGLVSLVRTPWVGQRSSENVTPR